MSRSTKKGPFIDPKLQKKVMKQKQMGDKSPIKTWARASQIPPEFVGHTFAIHNGKVFINVFIKKEWLVIDLANFPRQGHSEVTAEL